VRFNVCNAIAACPKPEQPCDDVVVETPEPRPSGAPSSSPAREEGDHRLPDRVAPGSIDRSNGKAYTIAGNVIDGDTQRPLAGVTVQIEGLNIQTMADASGNFTLINRSPSAGPNDIVLTFTMLDYRRTRVRLRIGSSQTDRIADVPLFRPNAPHEPAPVPEPPGEFRTYVLRIERTWEGRAPTAVVVSRAGCDPRPESRPSKEVGSVRLCVSKLDESSSAVRVRDRTHDFRQVGTQLLQRVARAIDVADGLTDDPVKDPNPRGRLIADALLAMLREEPAHSSCNLYDLICDIRRLITNDTPQCFGFPRTALDNKEIPLAGVFGQLIDDFREMYLVRGCDNCCDHVGIRIAHVITQELLPACAPRVCSIAAIDTHAPARETLHPRSDWYHPDQVPVYDAYFLGYHEAGVVLTARGLTVQVRETNTNSDRPTGFGTVWDWFEEIAPGEMGRFALYQRSVLYVTFGSTINLWMVAGRVVAITGEAMGDQMHLDRSGSSNRIAYLRRAIAFQPLGRGDVVDNGVEASVRAVSMPARGAHAVTEQPDAAASPETMRVLTSLDPVPFRDLIWGIGAKTESAFYLRGITTLEKLIDTPDIELAEMIRIGEIEHIREQAKDILTGKISFTTDELVQWGAAARLRKSKTERSTA
jgi:hypothetical protein